MAARVEEKTFRVLLGRATLLPLLLLAIIALFLVSQVNSLLKAADWAQHSAVVLAQAHECVKLLLDQETGRRGYVLTGNPVYLEPYNDSLSKFDGAFGTLKTLVADNEPQEKILEGIQPIYDKLGAMSVDQIEQTKNGVKIQITLEGKTNMDTLRVIFAQFIEQEEMLAKIRNQRTRREAAAAILVALLGSLVGGGALSYLSRRQLQQLSDSYTEANSTIRTQSAVLRQREEWLSTTLRSIGDGVLTTDRRGTITSINRAAEAILGREAKQVANQPVESVLPIPLPEGMDRHPALIAVATNQPVTISETQLTRNGEVLPLALSAAPLRGEQDGREAVSGSVIVLHDISERKAFEAELIGARDAAETANRTKSMFLANMSHELRTPLNAIIGYSEMLLEEAEEEGMDHFEQDLRRISGAGKHLLSLINDILDLSKIEAGKMELYLETISLKDMATDVAATVDTLIKKKNNTLVVDVAPDAGNIVADLTKIRQSLFNLVSNAAKFTENGAITLAVSRATSPSGDLIHFAIKDTGIGMNEAQLGRLFEAFTQADASTTRKYGGTGLGLAITRRFAQMMGGDVSVESTPSVGTTFTITLPAVVADPKAITQTAFPTLAEGQVPTAPRGEIVLVIDDDPAARDLLNRLLSRDGFHVEEAANGEDGLAKARAMHPVAITLDVMMPGCDGWAVLQSLKNDSRTVDIPVIMLSMIEDKNLGYALGASDYMSKPVDKERLLAVLNRFRCDAENLEGCHALVVEDDPNSRNLMRELLTREGWHVETAENGRVGWDIIAGGYVPRLILLDLMMPEMDGFEFAETLRADPRYRAIPIVVMTAKDLTAEDQRRLNGHVERVMQKSSWNRETLLQEVRALVRSGAKGD